VTSCHNSLLTSSTPAMTVDKNIMIYPKLQPKKYTSSEFWSQFQKQQEDSIMMLAITQKTKLLKHVIVSSFRKKVSGIPQVLQEVENLQF